VAVLLYLYCITLVNIVNTKLNIINIMYKYIHGDGTACGRANLTRGDCIAALSLMDQALGLGSLHPYRPNQTSSAR